MFRVLPGAGNRSERLGCAALPRNRPRTELRVRIFKQERQLSLFCEAFADFAAV